MTRQGSGTRSHAQAGLGTLFSSAAPSTSAAQSRLHPPYPVDLPERLLRARNGLGPALARLLRWHERARQRRQLMQLSDHLLRDLGITRATALGEAEKPFWRG